MQIERTRGDTMPDVCTVKLKRTNGVVNITGCSFLMTLSRVPDPVSAADQLYQVEGVITEAEKGTVEFRPTPQQADNTGYFYYDIQMTDSYGRILTLTKDTYLFTQDITK